MTISWKKDKSGLCGLINMGNTCYMNSIFQILLHHDLFVNYFISNRYEKDINDEKKESIVVKEFGRLVKGYWSFDKYHQVKPLSMMKVLWQMNQMFHPYRQNDAQEFLMFLMDSIHVGVEHPVRIKLKNETKKLTKDVKKAINHWKDFFGEKYSELVSIYYFQMKTIMQCENGHNSISFNPSSILSLDISNNNLEDCLKNHFKKESVEYKCETCKKQCTKQEQLQYLSDYLFIQLKRFQYTENGTIKIFDNIEYPETLSLNEYVDPSVHMNNRTYKLDGLVLHQGGANNGHYYSYQKYDNTWYKFDDESVTKKSDDNILNDNDVYVLVYKKI